MVLACSARRRQAEIGASNSNEKNSTHANARGPINAGMPTQKSERGKETILERSFATRNFYIVSQLTPGGTKKNRTPAHYTHILA
jgi:hypothetical protein